MIASALEFTGSFAYEREMMSPLVRELPRLLTSNRGCAIGALSIRRTPNVGGVTPDFLVGKLRRDLPEALARITYVEASVLACVCASRVADAHDLRAFLHLGESAASSALNRLTRSCLLSRSADGRLVPTFAALSSRNTIIAIEVKLRRWTDALAQAVSYTSFANETFVSLDGSRQRPRDDQLEHFEGAGVGLILQTGNRAEVVMSPGWHSPTGPARFLALARLRQPVRASRTS